jgi:hypothetical protein
MFKYNSGYLKSYQTPVDLWQGQCNKWGQIISEDFYKSVVYNLGSKITM